MKLSHGFKKKNKQQDFNFFETEKGRKPTTQWCWTSTIWIPTCPATLPPECEILSVPSLLT